MIDFIQIYKIIRKQLLKSILLSLSQLIAAATYFERARCIRKMMQHASILHRQRAPGSMRVLSRATVTRLPISGTEVSSKLYTYLDIYLYIYIYITFWFPVQTSWPTTAENPLLPSRCKESRPRGLYTDMSALCHAGHAGHRAVRSGRAHRWVKCGR